MRFGWRTRNLIVIIVFVIAQCLFAIGVTQLTRPALLPDDPQVFSEGFLLDYGQYNHLADSLMHGSVSLDLSVPEWLRNMDNPYVASVRRQMGIETGERAYFDYAFYDGKYYCYFGVLPAVTMFVPYKLMTGQDLPTEVAVAASGVALSFSIALFALSLLDRLGSREDVFGFVCIDTVLFFGSGAMAHLFIPWFYSLPPLGAMTCVFLGLAILLQAHVTTDLATLETGRLAAGSTLLGLTLLERPQFFLAVLLLVPLFWQDIREGRFFSRRGMANTIAVILPIAIVATVAMGYNVARFGSPFDFGASYNLTGFDMTSSSRIGPWLLFKCALAILVWPIDFTRTFPFIRQLDLSGFLGHFPVEPFFGGFFWFAPAALGSLELPLPSITGHLREARLLPFIIGCLIIAVPLVIVGPLVASVSMRYFSDFAWALLVPAAAVWAVLASDRETRANQNQRLWRGLLFALTSAAILLTVANFFSAGRYGNLASSNPDLYQNVARLFGVS